MQRLDLYESYAIILSVLLYSAEREQ